MAITWNQPNATSQGIKWQQPNNFTGLTPPPLTSDQSSGALGAVTGFMGNMMSGLKDISTGVAQSELGTVTGLGTLSAEAGSILPGKAGEFFAGGAEKGKEIMSSPAMQPQNIGQQIGKIGTDIAQFFIPGSTEESVVARGGSLIEKIPEIIGATGKTASTITNALKIALKGAVSGLSFGGVTAAQTGDIEKAKSAAEFGTIAGGITGALKVFGPEISTMLNKADFKLSPAKEAKTGKIAERAARFITKNKILGDGKTKFRKLATVNQVFETILQKSLPKDISVPIKGIIDSIENGVESLRTTDEAVYNQARSKANEAIELIKQKGDSMSVQDALSSKRSWANMAFKTAQKGKIDPTVSNEGAYAVEQAYQKSLEDTLGKASAVINIPKSFQKYFDGASQVSLSDFNKVYSDAINAKNLMGIAQYKNDAGLFGRMFGLLAGRMVGHAIMPGIGAEIVGMGTGEMGANKIASWARNLLERGIAVPNLPTDTAKVIQATQNQSDTGQNQTQ